MKPSDPRIQEWHKLKKDLENIIQDLDFDDSITAEHLPELRECMKPLSEFCERVTTLYATPCLDCGDTGVLAPGKPCPKCATDEQWQKFIGETP